MNFLEKDLETIIWENYEACEAKGLRIGFNAYQNGLRFRQMNLMPYGIADLINVYFNPYTDQCWVQVIECKKDRIDAATYLQAKRYGTAIGEVFLQMGLVTSMPILSYVLVGSKVDASGEMAHVISQDKTCQSFTYKYGVNGIEFYDASAHWWYEVSSVGTDRSVAPRPDIEKYILSAKHGLDQQRIAEGNEQSPLLISASGVLVNTGLIDWHNHGPQ